MKARPASSADLDAILAIHRNRPGLPGWKKDQFFTPGSRVTVVEEEGRVTAFSVHLLIPPEAQLLMIAVDPKRVRQGVGKFLLLNEFEKLKGAGFATVTLEVSASNGSALALYKGLGFVEVGRRKKYYGDGTDAILMDLNL